MAVVLIKKGQYFVVEDVKGNVLCASKDFGEADEVANKISGGKVEYAIETLPKTILDKLGIDRKSGPMFKDVFMTLVFSCIRSNPPDKILIELARMIVRAGYYIEEVRELSENEIEVRLMVPNLQKYIIYKIVRNEKGKWHLKRLALQQSDGSSNKHAKSWSCEVKQHNYTGEQK